MSDITGFRMMAEYSVDVLCCMTLERRCTYCSPSSTRVLGWSPREMLLLFPLSLIHPGDAESATQAHQRYMQQVEPSAAPDMIRVRKKDGNYVWMEVRASLMRDDATRVPWQILLNMRDVNDRVMLDREQAALVLTDALTGLANRRGLDQSIEHEWRRAQRVQSDLSLLLIDVDDFKGVNDTYGHLAGDDCLRFVASTVSSTAKRPGDLAARFGGDEFALILPATDADGAVQVAEQLRAAVESLQLPHTRNGTHGSVVTVSVGVATASTRRDTGDAEPIDLLMAADKALYLAKQLGRNRVERSQMVEAER